MNSIKTVINAFLEAPTIIKNAKLRKYYILPGIIGMILFVMIIFLANKFSNVLIAQLLKWFKIGGQSYGDSSLSWLKEVFYWLIKVIMWVSIIIVYFFIYKTILLVLISPILSYVSEKVDNKLTNRSFSFSIKENMSFITRGAHIGLICFIKQMIATGVIFILGIFIPPFSIIGPICIFIVQGYFTGFAFMDYTLERYKFSTKESMRFLKKKRIYSLLSGSIFTVLLLIPVLGIFVAPLITCVAVTRITLALMRNDKDYDGYISID